MFQTAKKILTVLFISFLAVFSYAAQQPKIKLGIDVLQDMNFSPLVGKRVGLLTHPAGVNRFGRSTIDVLRSARNVRLVALFGPEHGIYGDEKADVPVLDKIDRRTGLPVYSLYGKYRKPTPEMLKKIDVLVIDLQDVGSRSYTYGSCMLRAMEACFENGKQVVVLDRPNPLGGRKIDGPMLDSKFKSYVGMFNVPYVHGMTLGELAKFAKGTACAMEITSRAQSAGRLTVIPMSGWNRSMLWPDTGLKWVPTSPAIPNFEAAMGYSMLGLGCQIGGFQHGFGTSYPFRMLTFPGKNSAQIAQGLRKWRIRGVEYIPVRAKDPKGNDVQGLYVRVSDWQTLRPTEISFYLMKLACEFQGGNVFRQVPQSKEQLFNKHTGDEYWWREISSKGAAADVDAFESRWARQNAAFRALVQKFYIYK